MRVVQISDLFGLATPHNRSVFDCIILNFCKMLNQTTATQPQPENLHIVFQDFNGVFLAKISNLTGKETFAYGENQKSAEKNALANYQRKYHSNFLSL